MIDNTRQSLSFTLGDEDDLNGLLEDINSSYSAKVSCSFENYEDLEMNVFNFDDLATGQSKRKGIPDEIKNLSHGFTNRLFENYCDQKKITEIDNDTKKKAKPEHQTSFKKKVTMDSSTGFSSHGTKYATFFNPGSEVSGSAERDINFNYMKSGSLHKNMSKPFQHDVDSDFSHEKILVPISVGYAKEQAGFLNLNKDNIKGNQSKDIKKKINSKNIFPETNNFKYNALNNKGTNSNESLGKLFKYKNNDEELEVKILPLLNSFGKFKIEQKLKKLTLTVAELPNLNKTPDKNKTKENISNTVSIEKKTKIVLKSKKFDKLLNDSNQGNTGKNENLNRIVKLKSFNNVWSSSSSSIKSIQKINFFNSPVHANKTNQIKRERGRDLFDSDF